MQPTPSQPNAKNFGLAWLLLSINMALHTWDAAVHDFIGYYNATVLALYGHFDGFPKLDVSFRSWLAVMTLINLILFAFTPLAFRNARWLRPLAYFAAGLGLASGIGHALVTLRGSTVPSVLVEGVSPGFYSSLLLFVSAGYLLWGLRKSSAGKRGYSTIQST
jgi:hypothetical protein